MTTTQTKPKAPPVDRNGEFKRAGKALGLMRKNLDTANLPQDWQRWVIESLLPEELHNDGEE